MHGEYKVPGGKLVVMDLDVEDACLRHVQLSGDFFLEPDAALAQINAALEGSSATASRDKIAETVKSALDSEALLFGFAPEDVAEAVLRALSQGESA